jgi:hypothetical protein
VVGISVEDENVSRRRDVASDRKENCEGKGGAEKSEVDVVPTDSEAEDDSTSLPVVDRPLEVLESVVGNPMLVDVTVPLVVVIITEPSDVVVVVMIPEVVMTTVV